MIQKNKTNLWKIIGIILAIIIIGFCIYFFLLKSNQIDTTKFSYAVSPCNYEDKETFTNITILEDTVLVHQKLSYVCCANITLRYEINGTTLNIYEDNKGEICRCICNYEIKASIPAKNIGKVQIYGIYYPEAHPYELIGEYSKETCKNLCGDGICQEIVCMAVGCPCAETKESCPEDCS